MIEPDAARDTRSYIRSALATAAVVRDVTAETSRSRIERIGIVGAGTMGCGIAMAVADFGYPVTIVET